MNKNKLLILLFCCFLVIFDTYSIDYYFSGRKTPKSLVFKDKIFIIGGNKGYAGKNQIEANDIWVSNYGDTWERLTKNFINPSRINFSCAVFKNKIWVIGGYDQSGVKLLNDVWCSEDGVKWEMITNRTTFPKRENASLIVFKDKLWLIGGVSSDGEVLSDVWTSENGYEWVKVSDNHSINSYYSCPVIVYNDKLFYFSYGIGIFTTVDGLNWEPVSDKDDIISKRSFYTVEIFQDTIYVICGQYKTEDSNIIALSNEVLTSKDGKEWKVVSPEYDLLQKGDIYHRFSIKPVRKNHTSVVFKDRIFIFGGETG
ncbi:MAG TPA: hypothetical protein PK771_15830, partial [Spirochaetota bacterium]|nr:hypothetical protein [Spirochaetota bacterium]